MAKLFISAIQFLGLLISLKLFLWVGEILWDFIGVIL